MKRRNFLTTAALGAVAATVAPKVFSQDPYVEYAKMEAELLDWNEYKLWYVTPRLAKHNQSNNHWHLLQVQSEWGRGNIEQQWDNQRNKYFEATHIVNPPCTLYSDGKPPEPEYLNDGSGRVGNVMRPWSEGGLIYMHQAVSLRDYHNVYAYDGVGQSWMNVEDFMFYQRLMGMGEHGLRKNHLLGCGLVPGLVDPFRPTRYRKANQTLPVFVDGYEIHVMWRKR